MTIPLFRGARGQKQQCMGAKTTRQGSKNNDNGQEELLNKFFGTFKPPFLKNVLG
jgi:hypothetical protein